MDTDEVFTEPVRPPSDNGAPPAEEWQRDRNDKEWIPRQGKRGKLFRQGSETIEEARARDAIPEEERRPRRKPAKPLKPPGTRKPDLKKLEETLAGALTTPGAICMTPGPFYDVWAAEHFMNAGPYLARTLINASEYNPWLRRKLEESASGEDALMKVMGMVGIAGGFVMYFVPPTIYFLNLRVPDKAREAFGIPPRREPDYAPGPSPDQADTGAFSPSGA